MATDPEWKRKLFVGGLVLLLPVVGWPAILGYRKVVVERLVDGVSPVLPEWRGNFTKYVLEGFQAIGVIFAYLSPVIIWFVWRLLSSGLGDEVAWNWVAGILLVFPIFAPLVLPLLVTYLVWCVPTPFVSYWEASAMMTSYTALTFMIPAGFLRVSRHRRMWAAFHLVENARLIGRFFRRYCEAWIGSGCIALVGHWAIPFSPWGVMWCYLGIVYAFNEVPFGQGDDAYLSDSWIARVDAGLFDRYEVQRSRFMSRYRSLEPSTDYTSTIKAVRLGCLEIPIG